MTILWSALARQRFKTERTNLKSGIKLPHSKGFFLKGVIKEVKTLISLFYEKREAAGF